MVLVPGREEERGEVVIGQLWYWYRGERKGGGRGAKNEGEGEGGISAGDGVVQSKGLERKWCGKGEGGRREVERGERAEGVTGAGEGEREWCGERG